MTQRIKLPFKVKEPILACGADMKGAYAIARGDTAELVDGFGDLSDLDNFTRFEKSINASLKKSGVKPHKIICDLHPGYFSSDLAGKIAHKINGSRLYKVQHHKAHVASAIVDNGIKGKVIGVAFDGTGYGEDGFIWGGEFITGRIGKLERAAHLEYIAMPGAEKAIFQPWRMAASYLYSAGIRKPYFKKQKLAEILIKKKINSPLTSSVGRLFDAVGSLILSKESASREAELPIELERIAFGLCRDSYDYDIMKTKGCYVVSFSDTIKAILKDLSKKMDRHLISSKFHNTVASCISATAVKLRAIQKIDNVVLTGGVFQNKFLTMRSSELLKKEGFKVYLHSRVSTNDSGIPIGQIAIANGEL